MSWCPWEEPDSVEDKMVTHRSWMRIRTSRVPWLGIPALVCLCLLLAASAEAQQIQVTAADPPAAEQGTVNLNVSIKGKGFKKGAVAQFVLGPEENPDGIAVNTTTFVSAGELVANINIAETATIAKFDIKVRNADGRIGKGTELFAVLAKGSLNSQAPSIARAKFAPANGSNVPYALRSDGNFTNLCSFWDYVDKSDTCTGLAVPNDEQAVMSTMLTGNTYWFRPIPKCCSGDPVWDRWTYSPTRWVVLDFTNSGGACLNIDRTIADHASTNGSGANPPLNPAACVDFVEVRIKADRVFSKTTKFTSFSVQIDEPQFTDRLIWNVVYTLEYVNRVPVTHNANGTVTLATGNSAPAQLLGPNNEVLGTYNMPFSMTLQQVK